MIDLVDGIAAELERGGFGPVHLGRLQGDSPQEAIVVRRYPSTVTGRDMDRTTRLDCIASVYVRKFSELEAIRTADAVAEYLQDRFVASASGAYGGGFLELYTAPQQTADDGGGMYEYLVQFVAEIER